MSVVRSKRTVSKREYENTFTELYRFSEMQISKISGRRKRWICDNYNDLMNKAFNNVMAICKARYHNSTDENYINNFSKFV